MRELLTNYKYGEQALIIVDLQNDFVCGSLKVEGGVDAVRNTNSIRRKFKHIFLTRDWHPRNHCSFHENNPGTQLFETVRLTLPDGEVVDQVWCVALEDGRWVMARGVE
jgi:nicotinamidase-related amidase